MLAKLHTFSLLGIDAVPVEVAPFGYAMTWHPRVNTDAAHAWLRETVRGMGKRL